MLLKKYSKISHRILFLFLLFLFIILILYYFSKHSFYTQENYKGLSKVSEFEDLLEKKYTKVDREKKEVTNCIVHSTKNELGEDEKEEECRTLTYKYHFNKPDVVKFVKDKIATSTVLQDAGIPVPKFFKFTFGEKTTITNDSEDSYSVIKDDYMDNIMELEEFKRRMVAKKIDYPVVMKQIYGTFGIDVFTHIDSDEKAMKTIETFRDKGYKDFMCEEQIEGHCYRVFVFNNTIIDVIKRSAPFVIGDGINSVRSLIDMRNKKQLGKGLFETKNVSEDYILTQGYKMDDIPNRNKNIIISTVINMHNGADIERIPLKNVAKLNQKVCLKTNEVLGIMTSGIDFISKDISIPYNENKGRILEVNGTPDTEIHSIVSNKDNSNFNIYKEISNIVFL
jgi:glutathione synthase/RimK-type ligase-like ATP-grasp enzyme